MNVLLSENLPLRTTRILGDFAEDQVLPYRFGDLRNTRFRLIQLNDSTWFAADHPMAITDVYIDDELTSGWAATIESDTTGHSYTIVRLAAPAPPDAKVSASGIGHRDPVSGNIIENPADLMEFILRMAGRSETFPLLRAECAANDIRLAGSVDRLQSVLSWLDEIAGSAGAIWIPEAACLYPIVYSRGYIEQLDRFSASDLDVESALDDTADVLHLGYDYNDATGKSGQFVELTASPRRFGGYVQELSMRWLRSSANAESVGRRLLQRLAGERYSVAHGTDQRQLRPCTWTRIANHPDWPIPGGDPTAMVLGVEVDYETGQAEVTSEVIASVPEIAVTAHSVALPSTVTAAIAVAISNGVATFTISDEAGRPLKDAQVSLDGGPARKTNEAGKVAFNITPATPPKKHQLAVEAPGYTPFLLDVFL